MSDLVTITCEDLARFRTIAFKETGWGVMLFKREVNQCYGIADPSNGNNILLADCLEIDVFKRGGYIDKTKIDQSKCYDFLFYHELCHVIEKHVERWPDIPRKFRGGQLFAGKIEGPYEHGAEIASDVFAWKRIYPLVPYKFRPGVAGAAKKILATYEKLWRLQRVPGAGLQQEEEGGRRNRSEPAHWGTGTKCPGC